MLGVAWWTAMSPDRERRRSVRPQRVAARRVTAEPSSPEVVNRPDVAGVVSRVACVKSRSLLAASRLL